MSSEPGRSPIEPRSHEKAPVPSPSAPVPEPVFERARLDAVFRLVAGQVERGDLPAAALAIAGPRGIVRAEAFGRDGDRRVGVDDRFPIASITAGRSTASECSVGHGST